MPRYSLFGDKGAANVEQVLVMNNTATVRRIKVYDYMVACTATPADAVFTHLLRRTTADPTGASVTPSPLDVADAVAVGAGFDTVTVIATEGVILLEVPLNHRATYRWVAAPGSEFVSPATDNNGITGTLLAATTTDFSGTMLFEE
jgi:hypothetical protein